MRIGPQSDAPPFVRGTVPATLRRHNALLEDALMRLLDPLAPRRARHANVIVERATALRVIAHDVLAAHAPARDLLAERVTRPAQRLHAAYEPR